MSFIIVDKASQKSAIFSVRSAYRRPFNVGTWTEIRIGMYFTPIASTGDDSNYVGQSITVSSLADRFAFGIKSDDGNLPKASGSQFWGALANMSTFRLGDHGSGTNQMGLTALTGVTVRKSFCVTNGTSIDIVDNSTGTGFIGNLGRADSGTFNNFYGLRFIITDIGLSTQTVDIYSRTASNLTVTDTTALRAQLDNSWTSEATLAANDGATAWAIPTCFYLQNPLTLMRFKLHNHMIKKYA